MIYEVLVRSNNELNSIYSNALSISNLVILPCLESFFLTTRHSRWKLDGINATRVWLFFRIKALKSCCDIIDRKKNIFKLSQGEYVAPEKIENVVIQSLLIGQAFVHGDSLQSALVAVIVPDEDPTRTLLENSEEPALAKASFSEICKSDKLKSIIMADLTKLGRANGLLGFEIPKSIHLSDEEFSVENGLLTPTFKLKRQQARDKYEKEIERMYTVMSKPKSKL